MKVREVMTSPAITVTPETLFTDIAATLVEHGISGVPVVAPDGRLLGCVDEHDLVGRRVHGYRRPWRRVAADLLHYRDPDRARRLGGLAARELMTSGRATVGPDDDLDLVARRLDEHGSRALTVVADGFVVGVIAPRDLLRPLVRSDGEILTDVRRLLADPFRIAEDHAIQPSVADGVVTLDGTVRRATDLETVETEVARILGVIAVDNRLHPHEREPLAPHHQRW
jgi:CBS domain-containing protein